MPIVETEKTQAGIGARLIRIYNTLLDSFGHRNWWPAESPFEVAVGAILTQNTAWRNAALAIKNLKTAGFLSPNRLRRLPIKELAGLIRSAGYYNQKTRTLDSFLRFLHDRYDGRLERTDGTGTETLRLELLAVRGIGPETADSILLYALNRPVFVVDAYTRRIFSRHLFFPPGSSYDSIREFFQANLPDDIRLYNDFHAQIVALGHRFCRPRPTCEDCPLEPLPRKLIT
jgi:endonuclease-3 related protein